MTDIKYTQIISEIVCVAKMPTNCIDDMEDKDYNEDMAQLSIEYFVAESKDIVELNVVLATAKAFNYNVRPIEERIAYLQKKLNESTRFDFEFEMAIKQREDNKSREIENLFVAYDITMAEIKNRSL